ncbi:coiled-coil domain-containing protein 102A isoform X1 [Bactrocera neohumeralis]|uniref:coiled-coil domain-containing protein 102A isoform X1 n=1 Tax=Bactrocera tryoni TaxID=59916 RepID=UPI001A98AF66|nr:coiled-coil domain-containing protein 102A isoform X1 [Bactrocera tryoni]XP_050335681.1 coiled-coil domain-containing protein 102A isoform X1 [Bactrocera neohumeralis]
MSQSAVPVQRRGGTSETPRFGDATEWEAREAQRQRELDEARARAAQMEKTMKWWSDCTANWREKWSKVRTERNKAREESKQLRANLDISMKEANSYKREKNDLEVQISQLKKEMEKVHTLMMKHADQFHKTGMCDASEDTEANGRDANCSPDISSDGLKNVNSEDGLVTKAICNDLKDLDIEEFVLKGAVTKNVNEMDEVSAEEKRLIQQLSKDDFDEEYLLQKISMLQLRLDEAQKTVQAEREEKNILHKTIEKLTLEIQEVRDRQEELRLAKQEAVRELLTLQEQHRAEMRIINNSLHEETASRENLERRLSELRTELERLQAENASEWGKRERLETEKLALERDNKKLRAEVRDYQERSDRKGRPMQANDVEVRALQQELADRNKEISEIKLSHSKLKKLLAETNTELGHAVRRAEQYEAEVKRLRQRVEELKRELASAEDELDSAVNQVRRLQRSNDELVGQTEGLQVQIQHLQTRRAPSPQMRTVGGVQLRNKIAVEIPSECLPNINDLRQIFDDQPVGNRHSHNAASSLPNGGSAEAAIPKRSSHTERTLMQQTSTFFDAKPSHLEENIFESKSRNLEFERAKQKFDNPSHLQHQHHHHQREQRERSSGRFIGSGQQQQQQTSGNRSNLALPLKTTNTSSLGMGVSGNGSASYNSNANTNSNPNSCKDDVNRQLFLEDHSHSSKTGGAGGGNVGEAVVVGIGGTARATSTNQCAGGSYSRNSINLDGLKVSDDETP